MPNLMFRNKPKTTFPDIRKITKEQAISYLVEYLEQYNCFVPKDLENLDKYFDLRTIRKNEYFFKEHDVVEEIGFIVHGAIKQYKMHDHHYHVVYLLTEAHMSSSNTSWFYRKQSEQNAVCVEDTLILVINHDGIRKIVSERPVFLRYFADLTAEVCMFYEVRMTTFQMMDAQKRYENLLKNSPDLFNRFSLQDIANYIGIKPETLSRIRSTALKKAS
jgi:CRP-like cAMP-binding protein